MLVVFSRLKEPYDPFVPEVALAVLRVVTDISVRFAIEAYETGVLWNRPLSMNVPPDWLYEADPVEERNCLASTVPPLITTWPDAVDEVTIPPDSFAEIRPLLI